MTFWILKQIRSLVLAIISAQSPRQLAAGFSIGVILGLLPANLLLTPILVLALLIFNVNIAMGLLGYSIFSIVAILLSGLFHSVGRWILVDVTSLKPLFITLSQTPALPLSAFNHTIMMGSLLAALILTPIAYIGMSVLVKYYRAHLHPKVEKSRFYQALKLSKFGRWLIGGLTL